MGWGRAGALGLGGLLGGLFGRRCGGDFGVLELSALLALKGWAAVGEGSGLVGLLGQLALGVGHGQRAAVLHQLEQAAGLVTLGGHAGGAAAEGGQLPGVAGLDGGTPGGREAHAGEVCSRETTKRLTNTDSSTLLLLTLFQIQYKY